MKRIKVHDKYFKLYMSNQQIEESIQNVADKLNNDLKDVDTPIFLSVLNGSFMFTFPLDEVPSYDANFMNTMSHWNSIFCISDAVNMNDPLSTLKKIGVVVEDIVDTGGTIEELYKILKGAGAADVKICTLMYKPGSYSKDIPVDYVANSIPNDFILGFGLDYDQLGRQYKDVYVIDEQ